MTESRLINPDGKLLAELEQQPFLARKTKSIWAKVLDQPQEIETIEGTVNAQQGDYLCRGIEDEVWPQKADKVTEKYTPGGEWDSMGFQRFDPKPGAAPVQAAQVTQTFRVTAQWGELAGKANDYVIRSTTDPSDIWIVDKAIFEASYSRDDTKS